LDPSSILPLFLLSFPLPFSPSLQFADEKADAALVAQSGQDGPLKKATIRGKLNLVDLAGSERPSKTEAAVCLSISRGLRARWEGRGRGRGDGSEGEAKATTLMHEKVTAHTSPPRVRFT